MLEVLDVNLRYTESGAARGRMSAATGCLQMVPGLEQNSSRTDGTISP